MQQVKQTIPEKPYLNGLKELKKHHRNDVIERLKKIIGELETYKITKQYRNHMLQGQLKDAYELHVDNDVLLHYQYKNNKLILRLLDLVNHKEQKNINHQKQIKKLIKSSLNDNSSTEAIDTEPFLSRDKVTSKPKLNNDFVESFYRKHKKLIDRLSDDTILEEEIKHTKHSLSEEEMKNIICTMIDKYDASEEETFDELQSITPDISRDLVSRLYKMCNNNHVEENISQNEFNELWEELENLEE